METLFKRAKADTKYTHSKNVPVSCFMELGCYLPCCFARSLSLQQLKRVLYHTLEIILRRKHGTPRKPNFPKTSSRPRWKMRVSCISGVMLCIRPAMVRVCTIQFHRRHLQGSRRLKVKRFIPFANCFGYSFIISVARQSQGIHSNHKNICALWA